MVHEVRGHGVNVILDFHDGWPQGLYNALEDAVGADIASSRGWRLLASLLVLRAFFRTGFLSMDW
jgi:hypothetical protein